MITSLLKRWTRGGVLCAGGLVAALAFPVPLSARPVEDSQFLEIDPTLLPGMQQLGTQAPVVRIAQSSEGAQLTLRIQQLEEQVRNLTGQVEGLQFQLTQMQTLVERMNEDIEFRFQELEGGAGGKPEAATQSGDVTSPGVLPQTQTDTAAPAQTGAVAPEQAPTGPSGERLSPEEIVIDPTYDEPAGDVGVSADPLIGKANAGTVAPLGEVPQADIDALGNGEPIKLDLDSASAPPSGDADAQFAAGYEAVQRGDFDFAESQLSQFIALYPDDPRVPDATSYLGEALIQLRSYDEAAELLFNGFQQFETSKRAPDLLLKLGVALAGADEPETACRTFAEVQKRYPDQPPEFRDRLFDESRRAQCQG